MKSVYIVKAKRSAIGSFLGSMSELKASDLSANLIKHLTVDLPKNAVDEVILGNVLQGGVGQNSARQAAILGGLDHSTPAVTINNVCGSGLYSVALAYESIISGRNNLVLAGGHESMSLAMHAMYLRKGFKYGNGTMLDLMSNDGLTDAFSGKLMGTTAENIARKYNISREEQDIFSLNSQAKASKASKGGEFIDEILPIEIRSGKNVSIFKEDEYIRHDLTPEQLYKLKPVFDKDGTVTAGNSSGVNDGAALLMIASGEAVKMYNLKPLAEIKSFAVAAVDPEIMGTGPIPATQLCLKRAGWNINQLDLVEANEAFAAQAICVNKELGWDEEKVNVAGGAIALGHPLGASGCRIMVTLIHQMLKRNAKKGLATLCVGGGQAVAMCIQM